MFYRRFEVVKVDEVRHSLSLPSPGSPQGGLVRQKFLGRTFKVCWRGHQSILYWYNRIDWPYLRCFHRIIASCDCRSYRDHKIMISFDFHIYNPPLKVRWGQDGWGGGGGGGGGSKGRKKQVKNIYNSLSYFRPRTLFLRTSTWVSRNRSLRTRTGTLKNKSKGLQVRVLKSHIHFQKLIGLICLCSYLRCTEVLMSHQQFLLTRIYSFS